MQTSMGCCEAIKSCMGQNYANFSGRARRSEFWFFQLFIFLIAFLLQTFVIRSMSASSSSSLGINGFIVLYLIFFLITLIPSLAVTVRRFHDIGKSGLYIFIVLIPLAGFFIFCYYMCLDSESTPNMYGPSPKYNTILQNNTNQNLIDPNSPMYQNNPTPINAYPQQQQPPIYQQPYQNPIPQQPYQNPVPQQPYQNPAPQQPYQNPVPPESYQSNQQQPYQSPVPPESYNSVPQ